MTQYSFLITVTESQWPVHQISWQRSRYIYDLYYTYNKISKEVYDYCVSNKIVDPALMAKWKKPGYERLCSTYAINPRNYKFGTVSICRVPKSSLTTVSLPRYLMLFDCASGLSRVMISLHPVRSPTLLYFLLRIVSSLFVPFVNFP